MCLTWLGYLNANLNHTHTHGCAHSVPCLDHVCDKERLLSLLGHENLRLGVKCVRVCMCIVFVFLASLGMAAGFQAILSGGIAPWL